MKSKTWMRSGIRQRSQKIMWTKRVVECMDHKMSMILDGGKTDADVLKAKLAARRVQIVRIALARVAAR